MPAPAIRLAECLSWRLAAAAAVLLAATPVSAGCKLALALALDISASVDNAEYRLQIEGLAAALEEPKIIEAILTPQDAYIEVAVYEWSGYSQQDMIIGWTRLDSAAVIADVAHVLRTHQRPQAYLATAIGKAVEFGGVLLRNAPSCRRRVLDVSGDGVNNIGVAPRYFYDRGDLEEVIVNGLVILGAEPDPLTYYYSDVIFGPGAFVETTDDYTGYKRAMARKLMREIRPQMIVGER